MRKTVPAVALAVVAVLAAASVAYYYVSRNGPPGSDNSQCSDPDSISSHVYNSYRLNVITSCITASGVVENVFKEADGDYHLRLYLDSQYVSACQNYTNTVTIPSINDHVTVTGPYVLDTDHSNWAEIHPAYTLAIS